MKVPRKSRISLKISKKEVPRKEKRCDKVDNLLEQVKQGPEYICTICH